MCDTAFIWSYEIISAHSNDSEESKTLVENVYKESNSLLGGLVHRNENNTQITMIAMNMVVGHSNLIIRLKLAQYLYAF